MKIAFTPRVAYRMINRAKRNFLNYPCESVTPGWKKTLNSLQVLIVINPKFSRTCATAAFVEQKLAHKLFPIPDDFLTIEVDKKLGYFVIEMNPKLVVLSSAKEVFDTVSHELAHCLDFLLRGYENRSDDAVHDKFWAFLHRRMGGSGNRFSATKTSKILLQIASKRAKEIKEHFKAA